MGCKVILFAVSLACLSACSTFSLSPVIESDIADYQSAESDAANKLLLKNILRARDNVPLHFAEISQIHGSVAYSAGISALTIPFGDTEKSTMRKSLSPTLSFGQSPYFDLGSLDTQAFTLGITQPIEPKVIKYFLDNGLDQRIANLLFFSEYDDDQERRYFNSTNCATEDVSIEKPNRALPNSEKLYGCENAIWGFFEEINKVSEPIKLGQLRAHLYDELQEVSSGPGPLKLSDLKSVDLSKYKIRFSDQKKVGPKYQLLFRLSSDNVVFCSQNRESSHSDERRDSQIFAFPTLTYPKYLDSGAYVNVCKDTEIVVKPQIEVPNTGNQSDTAKSEPPPARVVIRSVYGIIQYLGEILRIQEQSRKEGLDRCIVLYSPGGIDEEKDYSSDRKSKYIPPDRRCSSGNVLFQVRTPEDVVEDQSKAKKLVQEMGISNEDANGGDVVNSLTQGDVKSLAVNYNRKNEIITQKATACRQWYPTHLPPNSDRNAVHDPYPETCDHSLEVLSLVTLLLNMNKNYKDLPPPTPTVQVNPAP